MIRSSVENKSGKKPGFDNRDLSPVESPKIIAPSTLALAQAVSDHQTESQVSKLKVE